MQRIKQCLAFCTLAAAVASCSRGGPDVVEVEGTVTYQGNPVPNVRIYFVPTSGRPSWGVSDDQGHFVLDYDMDHDGAKVDTHTVWLVDEGLNVDPTLAMSTGATRKRRSPELAAVIAKHSQDKSTLKVQVTKTDKNFQLKLD